MRACGFCSNDGGRAPRPGHRISAAQFLANAREKLRRNLPEPVIACQVPIVPPTLLPFRKDAKDGVSRDDGAFATNMAAVREPWVGEVLISDTMENAKRTIDKVHQASQWDIPSHPDGSPADANADAAAFQLRYWAGSDFYPVWDPVKEAHLPVWAQDVMDDDFLAKCRRSAFWEMTRLSKVSNIFPYSIPDPETELGREVSTAEKEGASELRLAKDHPLRLAVNMVATLPAGIRLGLCLAPRMLSLMKDIRIPNMAEQERQQSDTKTFDKDKIPTQIGFANGNLPAASVVMFSQVTFGLVRSVASSLFHHRSLPEPVVLQLLDALDTTISLLQIYPSFPHCVGIVGALADSEMVKTLVEVAVKGEPAASLASLKLLAKLIPDLVKLTHTAISGPEALELGQGSVAEDTFTTIQSTLVPGLEEVVVLACKQEPHHAAEVAANLAIILRASRFEDKLWDVSSAFLRIGRFMSQDADFITRFLIDQDTADPLVRKFPILLPPRVPGSSCNCRANEGNPQRSPVCHICFPYANILESKYGDRPVFGFRVDNGDRRHAVPVFDSGEAANLWLNELVEIGGGTEIGVERSYKDCKDALEKDEGYRAAPGVPRIVREKVQQLFPQHQLLMDELVRDETAMILGRVLGNLKVAVEKPDANGDAR